MSDQLISRFWDKYITKIRSSGIKPGAERWYVRHAETYINKHPHLKLVNHSASNVEKYIKVMGRSGHLQDWQIKQLVTADFIHRNGEC